MRSIEDAVDCINDYCFREVWNEIYNEYCVNIKLHFLSERYIKSVLSIDETLIHLPNTNTSYLVLYTPFVSFHGGLRLEEVNVWYKAKEILDNTKTLLYLYNREGKIIPRDRFYLKVIQDGRVIVAIEKSPTLKIFEKNTDPIYLTVYQDPDQPNDIESRSWYIDPRDPYTSAAGISDYYQYAFDANRAGTQILINGVEFDQDNASEIIQNLINDTYIEIILDRNVVGEYRVDVSKSITGYYSEKYKEYREILHCPKSVNPTNKLITNNTCTLSIVNNQTGRRHYLHRTDDRSIGQITHNDLSISTDVIKAFRAYLGSEDLSLYVRVRTHQTDNILRSECNFINLLYLDSDENIVQHLRGSLRDNLAFWQASHLENSLYINLMFDTPNTNSRDLFRMYVDGLGYYNVASILGSHVFTVKISDPGLFVGLVVPITFSYQDKDIVADVYLNGKKLKDDLISTIRHPNQKLSVSLSETIYVPIESQLDVVISETSPYRSNLFTPSIDNSVYNSKHQELCFYVIERLAIDSQGLKPSLTYQYAYKKIELSPGSLACFIKEDGSYDFVFGMSFYNKEILIISALYRERKNINLDGQISQAETLVIPLISALDSNPAIPIPYLNERSITLTLNGYTLIEGIDYTIFTLYKDELKEEIVAREVIITAINYINDPSQSGTNSVELTMESLSKNLIDNSFVINNKVSFDHTLKIWYSGLQRCFINGKLVQIASGSETISYLLPADVYKNGSLASILLTLPESVRILLQEYSSRPEEVKLQLISDYYRWAVEDRSEIIIVDESYPIYSPYMNTIIHDIVLQGLIVKDEPDKTKFLEQFASYAYIKPVDPCITLKPWMDISFVDLYPSYLRWTVTKEQYKVIHRLSHLVIQDPLSFGDIQDG